MTQRKLKILQIMECTIGGTRRHLRELSAGLARRGHSVTAICSAERDPTFRNDMRGMEEAGVTVIELPLLRAIRPAADLKHFLFMRRFLKSNPQDLIHTHSSKAGVLGRLAGLVTGHASLVHTPHTFAFAFKGHFGLLKRHLFMEIERFLCRRTARIVHVSASEREEGLQYGILKRDQAAVVENGIDPAPFAAAIPLPADDGDLPCRGCSPRLGTVGLLNAAKGHDLLIEAFAGITKAYPDAGLVIAGEGELRPLLEARIRDLGLADRVVLAGYRNDIPALLKTWDLFVFPSHWEGMPYVVLEAMAAQRPVLATDVNGSRDLVDNGVTGCLVPPGDADALKKAMRKMLDDPQRTAELARAGRERVATHYTLERMLDRIEALYHQVLSEAEADS